MIEKNSGPARIYAESVQTRVIDGLFYLELQSGEEKYSFIFALPLAKALGPGISEQITEIEKQTGQKFDGATSAKSMVSPWSEGSTDKGL